MTVISFGRPSDGRLTALREEGRDQPYSYETVGRVLAAEPPVGWPLMRAVRRAGSGADDFARGRAAVAGWAAQHHAGTVLCPTTPALDPGTVVAFATPPLGSMPLWVTGVCRIVESIDEERRFGFSYGTLPHHPVRGEEAFLVHHRVDGSVDFEVVAFSRPSGLLRLGAPVARRLQRRTMERYLDGYVAAMAAQR